MLADFLRLQALAYPAGQGSDAASSILGFNDHIVSAVLWQEEAVGTWVDISSGSPLLLACPACPLSPIRELDTPQTGNCTLLQHLTTRTALPACPQVHSPPITAPDSTLVIAPLANQSCR